MKKTDYMICCGKSGKYGTNVYRSVVTDGERYFIKWNGKIIDVTEDIRNHNYISKYLIK